MWNPLIQTVTIYGKSPPAATVWKGQGQRCQTEGVSNCDNIVAWGKLNDTEIALVSTWHWPKSPINKDIHQKMWRGGVADHQNGDFNINLSSL